MSEFIVAMGSSSNEYTVGEHTVTRVMAGEAGVVSARLVHALESLGYTVVSDNPLQARRARRRNIVSADFTDYKRRLSVGLRSAGAAATQVTFDFAVTHNGCMTKGDRLTLEREADALVALAQATPAAGLCRSCGTDNEGGARFCRLCGAPSVLREPAELEVLRLTAASRAGLQEIVTGLLIALTALAAALPLILFGNKPKVVNGGWILLAVGEAIGWWMAVYGILRTHRALRRKAGENLLPAPSAVTAQLPPAREAALPLSHFSVTEGTTELLDSVPREREKVHARREHSDTSPIG